VNHHVARTQERSRDDIPNSNSTDSTDDIIHFLPASGRSTKMEGETALNLVFEVAEVIRGTEDRASAIEKHAQSLAESATEELRHAKKRIQELETERQDAESHINEVNITMQEAAEVLKCTDSRLVAAEGRAIRAEQRAREVEMRVNEMATAMTRNEDTTRARLLGQRPAASSKLTAAV